MAEVRRLLLMRHAKAEQEAASDHARPLAARGRRDAAAAGALLAGRGEPVDLAVLSTAQRVRDTFAALCGGLGHTPPERLDRAIYDGGPDEIVEAVSTVDDGVRGVLVIGHNPTVEQLCGLLDGEEAAPAAREALAAGVPTAALAAYDVPWSWGEIATGRLRLTHFDVPRG